MHRRRHPAIPGEVGEQVLEAAGRPRPSREVHRRPRSTCVSRAVASSSGTTWRRPAGPAGSRSAARLACPASPAPGSRRRRRRTRRPATAGRASRAGREPAPAASGPASRRVAAARACVQVVMDAMTQRRACCRACARLRSVMARPSSTATKWVAGVAPARLNGKYSAGRICPTSWMLARSTARALARSNVSLEDGPQQLPGPRFAPVRADRQQHRLGCARLRLVVVERDARRSRCRSGFAPATRRRSRPGELATAGRVAGGDRLDRDPAWPGGAAGDDRQPEPAVAGRRPGSWARSMGRASRRAEQPAGAHREVEALGAPAARGSAGAATGAPPVGSTACMAADCPKPACSVAASGGVRRGSTTDRAAEDRGRVRRRGPRPVGGRQRRSPGAGQPCSQLAEHRGRLRGEIGVVAVGGGHASR